MLQLTHGTRDLALSYLDNALRALLHILFDVPQPLLAPLHAFGIFINARFGNRELPCKRTLVLNRIPGQIEVIRSVLLLIP
jgi:hypothetical protein